MRKHAILDFSSSSLSLLIARIEGQRIEALLHTRLAFSFAPAIFEGKALGEREAEEAVELGEKLLETCHDYGVEKVYAIASSTLSSLDGGEKFLSLIEEKLGLTVLQLDMAEEREARLIANERYSILPRPVLVDFGSLSLKLYGFSNYLCTIPIGPLGLYNEYVKEVVPSEEEAKEIKKAIRTALEEASLPEEGFFENAVLAGIYSSLLYELYAEYFKISHHHGEKIMQYKKLKKLCKYLVSEDGSRSLMILRKAPEMMHFIVPAAIMAKELLKRFGVSNILVSDLGVKEGILKEILSGKIKAEGTLLEVE